MGVCECNNGRKLRWMVVIELVVVFVMGVGVIEVSGGRVVGGGGEDSYGSDH